MAAILIFAVLKTVLFTQAKVAHLVEHDLAKVGVAGSSPVFRSSIQTNEFGFFLRLTFPGKHWYTRVVELVDTQDLKSCSQQCE
jgi:phage head maturation protease